ncbi:hypothetical protein TNIN_254001 [Trichonephila inaurata madagascariensis]|uniref:Uncharacterized protein n=1 Tax=Trichonephila inaurata madagascariensis TaxID=2747483 RepID=A0A8X7CBY6_9ARAC|nr:hypothetical protein TNIN_254001 [Trichonephila inaurata madagascariensis]
MSGNRGSAETKNILVNRKREGGLSAAVSQDTNQRGSDMSGNRGSAETKNILVNRKREGYSMRRDPVMLL